MPICDEVVCWFFIQRSLLFGRLESVARYGQFIARSGLPVIQLRMISGLGLSALRSLASEFQIGLHSFSEEGVCPGSVIPVALQRVKDNKRWRKAGRRTCRRHGRQVHQRKSHDYFLVSPGALTCFL